jgi:hypothetical protein
VSGSVRVALAGVIFLLATSISAAPARLLTVSFSAGCDEYTITVTGEGLDQPGAVLSYNITLTPPSGEPIAVVESFPVTPEKDGSFHKTVKGTWKHFEYTLTGKYVLSGSAILSSNLIPLHTLPIAFSPAKIDCSQNH